MTKGTLNSKNDNVSQVAAALADACHAGGLSDAYYRKADDSLAEVDVELERLREEKDRLRGLLRNGERLFERHKQVDGMKLVELEAWAAKVRSLLRDTGDDDA